MDISDEAYARAKILLGHMFEANAVFDNVAYNFNFRELNKMGDIYHLSYAHLFPATTFADGLSDKMLELNARPIRMAMPEHSEEQATATASFEATSLTIHELEKEVSDLIGFLDNSVLPGDKELRIYLENVIEGAVCKARKQADEWLAISHSVTDQTLNIHFEDYTHFITIVK